MAEREVEAIDDQVFIARISDLQSLMPRMNNLRKSISFVIRCLHGKVDVLNAFVKRCQTPGQHPTLPHGELLLYLGDVQDHLVTITSNLAHFDGIIRRSQANCLAQTSATSLRLKYKVNALISKLTIVATIVTPMHMVTWLFGMNVPVPGQSASGLGWWFGIFGVLFAAGVVCFAISYKTKLI